MKKPTRLGSDTPCEVAASIISRKWSGSLGNHLSFDDLTQQAWVIKLEGGWRERPEYVDPLVFETGEIISRLNDYCRSLYSRVKHEVQMPEVEVASNEQLDFPDDNPSPFSWVDALDFVESSGMNSEEKALIYLKAAGFTSKEIALANQESRNAVDMKLFRLRERIRNGS